MSGNGLAIQEDNLKLQMKLKYNWKELKNTFGFTNEQIQRLVWRKIN